MDKGFLGLWIFLISLSLLLFLNPLRSYFSQDDFFHLRIIMDKNIGDIPSFFVNRLEGQTFYRPISRETYNLVMYKLFGLNPLPFHIVNFGLILLNLLFMSKLIRNLTSSPAIVFFSGLIFSISSVHSIEIYYLPSIQTLLSTSLALLAIIFFTNFIQAGNFNYYLASILFYCLALFNHESAIILPGILFLYTLLFKKFDIKKLALLITPYLAIGMTFLLSTPSITDLPEQAVYRPTFQLNRIFNTLGWYIMWSLGAPEMLVDFIGPRLALKIEFITWYGHYAKVVFPLLFFISSLLFLMMWSLKNKILKNKLLIFFTLSFFVSTSPFVFFPQHKFVYYLSLSNTWFCAALGVILAVSWKSGRIYKAFTLLIIFFFIIISYQTINLNAITYWAAKRAKAAEVLIAQFREEYPKPGTGTVFYIIDDPDYPDISKEWGTSSRQAFYILSGSDALKLLYNDSSIRAYYQANGNLPSDIDKTKIIKFTAKFPY